MYILKQNVTRARGETPMLKYEFDTKTIPAIPLIHEMSHYTHYCQTIFAILQ